MKEILITLLFCAASSHLFAVDIKDVEPELRFLQPFIGTWVDEPDEKDGRKVTLDIEWASANAFFMRILVDDTVAELILANWDDGIEKVIFRIIMGDRRYGNGTMTPIDGGFSFDEYVKGNTWGGYNSARGDFKISADGKIMYFQEDQKRKGEWSKHIARNFKKI